MNYEFILRNNFSDTAYVEAIDKNYVYPINGKDIFEKYALHA